MTNDSAGQAGELTFEVTEEMWEATRDALARELGWVISEAGGPEPSVVAERVLEAVLIASKPQGLSWLREGRML